MCTVSFIPLHNKMVIAHNRDEKSSRTKAAAPAAYTVNGHTLLFPRDSAAGGTWIACNKNGGAAVLLNGAFERHAHLPPYKKSRGLAFLDIVAASDLYLSFNEVDLAGIEPFTIIIWSNSHLHECRWDGAQKHISKQDAALPHIWSSVTLYDEGAMTKRKSWFYNWLKKHRAPSTDDIIQFHLTAGDGDANNDLCMNRDGKVLTISVTAIEIREDKSIVKYLDLQDNTRVTQEFIFTKAAAI